MAVYIVLTVIFLVFGIIFAFNKGDFLIAGLNNSESNQNEYDTKKINRMFAVFSVVVAVVSFIGIFVNKVFYMVGILFPVVVVGVVLLVVFSNKICKNKWVCMKNLVENLKQKINNRTPLGEIVDIFCEECRLAWKEFSVWNGFVSVHLWWGVLFFARFAIQRRRRYRRFKAYILHRLWNNSMFKQRKRVDR